MKLLVIILNNVDALDDLMARFAQEGIRGATILSSTGMARELAYHDHEEEIGFLGSLRALLDPDRAENRTILTVLRDEQVELAIRLVQEEVGDLNQPDTGILFTVPVDRLMGVGR